MAEVDSRVNVQEILRKFETNLSTRNQSSDVAAAKNSQRTLSERAASTSRTRAAKAAVSAGRKSNTLGGSIEVRERSQQLKVCRALPASTTSNRAKGDVSVSEISRLFQEKRNADEELLLARRNAGCSGKRMLTQTEPPTGASNSSRVNVNCSARKENGSTDVNAMKMTDNLKSRVSDRILSSKESPAVFGRRPPPRKPARTYAHDAYLNSKQLQWNCRTQNRLAQAAAAAAGKDCPGMSSENNNCQKVIRTESDKVTKPKLPPKPVVRSKTVPNLLVRGEHHVDDIQPRAFVGGPRGSKGSGRVVRPLGPPPQPPMARPTTLEPYVMPAMMRRCLGHEGGADSISAAKRRNYCCNLKRSFSDEHIYDEPWTSSGRCSAASCESVVDAVVASDGVSEFEVVVDNEIYGTNGVPREEACQGVDTVPSANDGGHQPETLHYMSSPVMGCGSPTAQQPGGDGLRCRSRSVSSRNVHRHLGRAVSRKHSCRMVNDKDLVNWSFSSVYATAPKRHESRANKDNDSCDSEPEISEKEVRERIAYIHKISRFDAVLTVGLQLDDDGTLIKPVVRDVFPSTESLKADVSSVASFCFPDAESWRPSSSGEVHTFVLTDELGERLFGYCRRVKPEGANSSLPIVYCIISPILARSYYSEVLKEVEKRHGFSDASMKGFLQVLRNRSVPHPGRTIHLRCSDTEGDVRIAISRSNDCGLDNGDTFRLLHRLSISNLLHVFSCLLLERRVLFYSSDLNVLTESILALVSLLYPFAWQHTLVPILPGTMLEVISSPTPYVIGITRSSYPSLADMPLEEGIIVDLDESQVVSEYGDEDTILPKKITKGITASLRFVKHRSEMPSSPSSFLMSEAFLTMFVRLIGHYRQHVEVLPDGQKIFNRDSFCSAPVSRSEQLFLRWFTETQMFQIFIDKKMAANVSEYDVFEKHIEKHRMDLEVFKPSFRTNVFGFGMKVKHFGEKLIGLKSPNKA